MCPDYVYCPLNLYPSTLSRCQFFLAGAAAVDTLGEESDSFLVFARRSDAIRR